MHRKSDKNVDTVLVISPFYICNRNTCLNQQAVEMCKVFLKARIEGRLGSACEGNWIGSVLTSWTLPCVKHFIAVDDIQSWSVFNPIYPTAERQRLWKSECVEDGCLTNLPLWSSSQEKTSVKEREKWVPNWLTPGPCYLTQKEISCRTFLTPKICF